MDSQRQDSVEERFLDIRESAQLLDVTEKELWELVRKHQVPTHTIAGAFLRFRKHDIEELKIKWRIERELFPKKAKHFVHDSTVAKAGPADRLRDLWYFNDFYIVCSALAAVLLFFIVSSQ